ncbi:MAG: hypothetical protein P0Y56_16340 [Candidatus Andeanibacterium colombiense]|uniref:Lipoprotein n=1 Tax=Candidatus Andeanibacterium colombiense TaxID=3121345 RepID=A0AAJ6BMM5_9SPHN|nr:MAG: hypothetical protein P0Y56_16340 [Sphingomonadaceae bacterium]
MKIRTNAFRAGAAAMLACSILLTGCYDGRPGHNSDRHGRHDHGHHHDGDHHDGDHHD